MTARLPNLAIVSRTCVLCLALAAGQAAARDYFVDQKHPAASDKNPGTLAAPFKTIQAALDKAQADDTVQVRGGVYHEGVTFRHSGNPGGAAWNDPASAHWITLAAYKDDRVVLDGSLTIPAEDWKLVEGRANTYVASFECKAHSRQSTQMVFVNDTLFMPTLVAHHDKSQPGLPMVPAMPGDKTSDLGWYHDLARNKLFVNLGGRVPGKDVQIAAAQLGMGVNITYQSYIRIKGIEIRRFNERAIWSDYAREFMVEDNFIHHCQVGLWSGLSSGGIIRGNTFSDIMFIAMGVGGSRGTFVEGNLIKRYHVNPFKLDGGQSCYYYSAAIMCNGSFGLVARNNTIAEGDVDGIWPDCASIGITLYGNAIYGTPSGFYIEADAHGTVLQWNTVFDSGNGIVFRQNSANTALENYVFNNRGGGLAIGSCDASGVMANTMMYNWLVGNGRGAGFGPDSLKMPANVFDHNVYCRNRNLFQFGGKQCKDIQSVRDNVGVEMHGEEVKDFDPTPLGLVTFRVHDTKNSWKPVPMFGNPGTRRVDIQDDYDVYFWKRGTFLRPEPGGWGWDRFGGIGGRTRANANGFVRQLASWDISFFASKPDEYKVDKGADDPSAVWTNNVCLQACAAPGKTVSAEGLGYWSARLPTTDNAQIDLSLCIRAKGIKSADENGGVYALAEFCDETGQNITRQYIVGANDGEKLVGSQWAQGTYKYQKAFGTVTAPKGARWFKMGFGIRNCSGWAAFNNFDIQTRPGEKPKEAKVVLPIDAKRYAWTPCDLTGLLNRPLADDANGDGKRGWTGQGPTADLRNLYAGDYTYNGVACRVAKGNACFIMKNKHQPSQNLPTGGKVELQGKADVLAVLHSGAWIDQGVRQATYVIRYADGTKAEIPVIGGKNILDWTAAPGRADEVKYDPALGLLLPATSVPSPQFVHVTVWMLLWKNPQPDKQIVALEVKGEGQGIPGLIGVSFGVAK